MTPAEDSQGRSASTDGNKEVHFLVLNSGNFTIVLSLIVGAALHFLLDLNTESL